MGMNIHTATEKIKTFLDANLVDPLNARTTAWIYSDGMRVDLDKSPYPKILLKKTEEPSLKEQTGVGEVSTINTDTIFIEIRTDAGNNYTQDNVEYSATAFAAEISRQAETLIKNNHDSFVALGFLHVIAVRDEITSDKDRNPTFSFGIEMMYISAPD